MLPASRLVQPVPWVPVHGATVRADEAGNIVFGDSRRRDWCLLRWEDPRLNGVRVKLAIVAQPAEGCDTNLYVHHWGGKDVCSVDSAGNVVIDEGAEELSVDCRADGALCLKVIFRNEHRTLSIGTGKPRGHYEGSGRDQYVFKDIEVELLPLNETRQVLIDRLWKGHDPLAEITAGFIAFDVQGWNSQHPYLSQTIGEIRPQIIAEIGVWKGGSTIFMANALKQLGGGGAVIAIDTWLGSSEHWLANFNDLAGFGGRPLLYHKFLSNVVQAGVADCVVPLPIDSLNAAQLLRMTKLVPDLIHVDAGHDYQSVIGDLSAWWPLLKPGGVLIGDDYYMNGVWPGVRRAFDEFFGALGYLLPLENDTGKCRVTKTG
jgi:predicted O-methyltransferase YrrM